MPVSHDDLGILSVTDGDEPWLGVPAEVALATECATSADDVVTEMLDGPHPWAPSLQRHLLHPSSGVAATLVPAGCATALDLGTGWLGLAPALASLGIRVTRADWVYPRLRLARLLHSGATDVHVGLGRLPPHAVRSFDAVFLDLDDLALRGLGTIDLTRLLTTVHAALAPGGSVVVATTDRRLSLLRTGQVGRALHTPGVGATVRRSGLRVRRVLVPLPDLSSWQVLVPRSRLRDHLRAHDRRTGPKRVLGRLLLAVGATRALAPGSLSVLAPPGTGPVSTLADRLVGGAGRRAPLVLALSDARVSFLGSERFVKVALSQDQRQALRSEAERTRLARGTALAPFVLPPPDVRDADGVLSVTYRAVAGRPVGPSAAAEVMSMALAGLTVSDLAPLPGTAVWSRLSTERGKRDLTEVGAQSLWRWLGEACRDVVVPVGPSHGDLHPDNVIVPVTGTPLLVDWNRFEMHNPLVLDPLYAAVQVLRATTGCSLAAALARAAADELTGPLADRARAVRGELDAQQATVLLLLDRLASYSLPRRRFKPWTLAPFEDAVRTLSTVVATHASDEAERRPS